MQIYQLANYTNNDISIISVYSYISINTYALIGNLNQNVVPFPSSEINPIFPPEDSIISLEI